MKKWSRQEKSFDFFQSGKREKSVFCDKFGSGLPDLSWDNLPNRGKMYQITTIYTKWQQNIPKRTKTLPNGHKIYQYLTLHDPPKFTQTGIFGLKKCAIWQAWFGFNFFGTEKFQVVS
jgi:hypothetical protein